MNLKKLYDILKDTTWEYRKGDAIVGDGPLADELRANVGKPADKQTWPSAGGVVEIYMMPHADDAPPEQEMVDCEFIKIGVDRKRAEARKAELIEVMQGYPDPERLAGGPSYIEVGGVIGDQSAAFSLFALGKVLGLWGLITPATFGFEGVEARRAAENGFVMMAPGYHV